MRVPGDPNLFVAKGRGYRMDVLSRMRPEDMVVWDLEGNWVNGPPYSLQCSEVKIHSCIYKNRPDVVSVVHVHPDYVVLMSVLGNGLKPVAQEGVRLVTTPLPLYRHTKIITSERGRGGAAGCSKRSQVYVSGAGAGDEVGWDTYNVKYALLKLTQVATY
jgi:ribulose-5-phosphate 4-epimerase/fuculose-1-phosphate aldolase